MLKKGDFAYMVLRLSLISIAFLLTLLVNVSFNGLPAFQQTYINLEANLDEDILGVTSNSNDKEFLQGSYSKAIKASLKMLFSNVKDRGRTIKH